MGTLTTLTNEAKKIVLSNRRLRIALFLRWDVSSQETLRRWCRNDAPQLTHPDTIALICSYAQCGPESITEVVAYQPAEV